MNPSLQHTLSSIIPFESNHFDLLASKLRPVTYSKGEYFAREGQVVRYLAYIVKGCLMCKYHADGKEYIDEFSLENEFITAYDSFVNGSPADKSIICIEECDLLLMSYQDMQELYALDPIFERFGRIMAEMLLFSWQQRTKSLLLDNAETRYYKLIEERPALAQRIPQYLLAEYLRVTPETLSRIRRRIS